jgi:hypothetical protein
MSNQIEEEEEEKVPTNINDIELEIQEAPEAQALGG